MISHARSIALVLASAVLASCTTGPQDDPRMAAQQQLDQLLAGKVAGPEVQCVPAINRSAPSLIAPRAIAITASPDLVYVADTAGTGCEGSTGLRYSLVTSSHGPSGLCAGDFVQIRDLQSGMTGGSCTLSGFVPYRRP